MNKFTAIAAVIFTVSCVSGQHYHGQDNYNHGQNYEFQYEVHDPYHHDIKGQAETKIGDLVKGHYRLKETDGSTRDVVYTASKHSGFQAVVHKDGHQVFPEIITKAQYAEPVGHAGYQPQQQYYQPQQQYYQPQHHEPLFHYTY